MVPPMADMFRTVHDMQRGHKSYAVDYVTAIFRLLGMVSLLRNICMTVSVIVGVWLHEFDCFKIQ